MFTVCPKCTLKLVVTAADLRVAQGYVRCGRCSNVFNALAGLSDEQQAALARQTDPPQTPPAPRDSAGSGTAGETAPPGPDAASRAAAESGQEAASGGALNLDLAESDLSEIFAPQAEEDDSPTGRYEALAAHGATLPADDDPLERTGPIASAEALGRPDDPRDVPAQPDAHGTIDFQLEPPAGALPGAPVPAQDSAATADAMVAAEVEAPAAAADSATTPAADADTRPVPVADTEPAPGGAATPVPVADAEPALDAEPTPDSATTPALDPDADTEPAPDTESLPADLAPVPDDPVQLDSVTPVIVVDRDSEGATTAAADVPASPPDASDPHAQADAHAADVREDPETAGAGGPPTADAPPATGDASHPTAQPAIPVWLAQSPQTHSGGQEQSRTRLPALLWTSASVLLALVLAAQIMHHYRDVLATNPRLRPALTAVYGALGVLLVPRWNVKAYEVRQLGATVGAVGSGELTVRASIQNTAPVSQPLPLLRVTVLDRFGNRVAARDVAPAVYAAKRPPAGRYLASGQRIDTQIAFVDPGRAAVGFEIDACVRRASGATVCANGSGAQ